MPADIAAVQGDLAKYALGKKWVDGLKTQEEVDDLLVKRGVADDGAEGGFRQVSFGEYLANLNGALPDFGDKGHVAVKVCMAANTGAYSRRLKRRNHSGWEPGAGAVIAEALVYSTILMWG